MKLDIECGSGTYIRAIARDVGEMLGTGAVMSALDRTAIGSFRVEDAVSVKDLNAASVQELLQPASVAVADLRRVKLSETQRFELRHGRPILSEWLSEAVEGLDRESAEFAAVDSDGQLAAILFEKRPGELWPLLNFNESA
jgi:tRNA pseudouridine55 synthase